MNKNNLEKNNNQRACPEKSRQTGRSRGFTLIETIVAIFILVLAVTGPMSAAQNSLKASFLARDQVVAFYLAQDAIEYLKNYKDQKIIENTETGSREIIKDTILAKCSRDGVPCAFSTLVEPEDSRNFKQCGNAGCGNLCFSFDKREYYTLSRGTTCDLSGSKTSKFIREVYIKEIEKDEEYAITVVIRWKPNFFTDRKIVVQENLYNWLPTD